MICTSAHANAYAHSFQDPMLMSLPMLMFVLIYNLMLKLLPMLMPRPAGSCSFHNLIHEHMPMLLFMLILRLMFIPLILLLIPTLILRGPVG